MSLTKVSKHLIQGDLEVDTINGYKLSMSPKENSIPVSGPSGKLDPGWGIGTGGSGGSGDISASVMYKEMYDPNGDGTVDKAETANKLSQNPGKNKIYATDERGDQVWLDQSSSFLSVAEFAAHDSDGNVLPKVKASEFADKIGGSVQRNKVWGTDSEGNQEWVSTGAGDMLISDYGVSDPEGNTIFGLVKESEVSQRLVQPDIESTESLNNCIWYRSISGEQSWRIIDKLDDIMVAAKYTNEKGIVRNSEYAEHLTTESNADNNTVYMKDSGGNVRWLSISNALGNPMTQKDYAYIDNGQISPNIVREAHVASELTSSKTCNIDDIYCKTGEEEVATFKNIFQAFPTIVKKSDIISKENIDANIFTVKRSELAEDLELFTDMEKSKKPFTSIVGYADHTQSVNFYSIEAFINPKSYVKSSWCGVLLKARSANNSKAKLESPITNKFANVDVIESVPASSLPDAEKTPGEEGQMPDDQAGEDVLGFVKRDQSLPFLAQIDYSSNENYIIIKEECCLRITFYTTDLTSTAHLLKKSNSGGDDEMMSPDSKNFISVPLICNKGEMFGLYVNGTGEFEFFVEII